jgi:hypothetical protein
MLSGNKEKINSESASFKISCLGTTGDKLTGRAGLSFFLRYLDNIGINPLISKFFGSLRRSSKGVKVVSIFKQVLSFFVDGSSRHLTYFDQLKEDEGYAASLESDVAQLCSSHSIKRFFKGFSFLRTRLFRRLYQRIFLWRLRIEKPEVLVLDIDTVVLDNDDAKKRWGVSPTYKKKKGFQPFLVKWDRYIIDAVFRGGKKHSNHGETVKNSLGYIVRLVRNGYGTDIPIIVTCDSGFFDEKLFDFFEDQLGILYVCTGKMYDDIGEHVAGLSDDAFFIVEKHRSANECSQWKCTEFFNGRKSRLKERRAIYTVHIMESNQRILLGQESIYYTNIGDSDELRQQLIEAGDGEYLEAAGIVKLAHQRGEAELVHRNLKEFGFQQMPFKRFASNEAFFYMMVLSFNLYESYKWDVCKETGIVPLSCQPNTFRRRLIDFAGKIVRHGRRTILKVTWQVRERLQLDRIWVLCNRGPEVLLI